MIFRQCPDRPSISFLGAAINQVGGTTSLSFFLGFVSLWRPFFSAGFYTQYRNAKPCYPYTHYLASLVFLPSDDPAYLERSLLSSVSPLHPPCTHISWTKTTQSVWHVVSRQTETCSRLRKYFSRHQKTAVHHDLIFFPPTGIPSHSSFHSIHPFFFCADSAARYNRQIKRLHSDSERKFG